MGRLWRLRRRQHWLVPPVCCKLRDLHRNLRCQCPCTIVPVMRWQCRLRSGLHELQERSTQLVQTESTELRDMHRAMVHFGSRRAVSLASLCCLQTSMCMHFGPIVDILCIDSTDCVSFVSCQCPRPNSLTCICPIGNGFLCSAMNMQFTATGDKKRMALS